MDSSIKQILVVAGEASGDERAAEVLGRLKEINPQVHAFGIGGDELRAIGCETLIDIRDTAVIGILEAVTQIAKFNRLMKMIEAEWLRRKPVGALLVDFGGFNLRLARRLKKYNGKVAYYISPQIWASRPGRARMVREYVDLMMVLFKFEEDFYRQRGIEAVHVGHPLVDLARVEKNRRTVLKELMFPEGSKLIGLMPGSREKEIRTIIPILRETGQMLSGRGFKQFVIIAAQGKESLIREMVGDSRFQIVSEDKYSVMAACDILLITSGTAALEAALLGKPAIILYKTSWITAKAAKMLLNVKYIALPNIILAEEVYPELIQERCRPEFISRETLDILVDSGRYDRIRSRLAELKSHLGESGSVERTANRLSEFLELL